jgi:hypothetical protein
MLASHIKVGVYVKADRSIGGWQIVRRLNDHGG